MTRVAAAAKVGDPWVVVIGWHLTVQTVHIHREGLLCAIIDRTP